MPYCYEFKYVIGSRKQCKAVERGTKNVYHFDSAIVADQAGCKKLYEVINDVGAENFISLVGYNVDGNEICYLCTRVPIVHEHVSPGNYLERFGPRYPGSVSYFEESLVEHIKKYSTSPTPQLFRLSFWYNVIECD